MQYDDNSKLNRDLREYAVLMSGMNEYEKVRNRNFRPVAQTPLEEKARMENMVAQMRREDPAFVKKYAKETVSHLVKNTPLRQLKFDNKEIPVSDLSYMLAESLQYLYSSEDPRAEYYNWVEEQRKIEVEINTNGTTDEEIAERTKFLGFLDDRETELKLVIALYQSAARGSVGYYKEMALNKLSFLNFKLSELRRLRERTEQTKSKSDEQERRERALMESAQKGAAALAMTATVGGLAQYAQNRAHEDEFMSAMENVHPVYRPVTRSVNDIMAKKETLLRNRAIMRENLMALRMGKSLEQVRREQQEDENEDSLLIRRRIERLRGFERDRFYDLNRDAREYA